MDTNIGYLQELREDLLEAAWQAERGDRYRGRRRIHWSKRRILAAASAVLLVAAGVTGWVVTRSGPGLHILEYAPVAGSGPLTHAVAPAPGAPAQPPTAAFRSFGLGATNQQTTKDVAAAGQSPAPLALIPGGLNLSKVIKTANLSVVVPAGSFEQKFGDASQVAGAVGGYVQSSTTHGGFGTLTMRVPAGRFDVALTKLRALGHIESQTIRGQDVTAQYIDLRARLQIEKARRAVLLGLMRKSHSIAQTITVQNALDETQHQIEDLQGSLNVLNNQTSFGTISLELREQGVQTKSQVTTPSILNGWERAIAGFVGVIVAVIVGLGYVVPIAAVLGLAWLVVSRVRRRRLARVV